MSPTQIESTTGFWTGAFVRGRLVGAGFCRGGSRTSAPVFKHALYLADYVHPAYRRRGIARQLHVARLQEIRTLGCTAAFAWVHPDNLAALAALRSAGFALAENPCVEVPFSSPAPGFMLVVCYLASNR